MILELLDQIIRTKLSPSPRPGDFQALIDAATYRRVQDVLSGRGSRLVPYKRNNPDFPLRRFVRCQCCEKPLTGSWSKGRNARYAYYRCPSCGAVSVKKQLLEKRFENLLGTISVSPGVFRLFQEIVRDVWTQSRGEAHRQRHQLQQRLHALVERKRTLDETFIYRRDIDKATYDDHIRQLETERDITLIGVDELDVATSPEPALNFAQMVLQNPSEFWRKGSVELKQRFQRFVFPDGLVFDGTSFGTARMPFVFSYLESLEDRESQVASPTGLEPSETESKSSRRRR